MGANPGATGWPEAAEAGTTPQFESVESQPVDITQAHARLLRDETLQFDLPAFDPPEPPVWIEPLLEWLAQMGPVFSYVFWGGVIVVAALLLYALVSAILRRLPDRRNDKQAPSAPVSYRPEPVRARALLEEADRLAAAGRYGEAARILLHRSIDDLEERFSLPIRPGYTSREIAQLESLSHEGRNVFSAIARAVETSLFGGRELSSADYAGCRQAYAGFALGGRSR
jgi:hypothetical protein